MNITHHILQFDDPTESWKDRSDFRELIRNNIKVKSLIDSEDFNSIFDYEYYTRHIDNSFNQIGLG